MDQKIYLMLGFQCIFWDIYEWGLPNQWGPSNLHVATCAKERIVAYMHGNEELSSQVYNLVMQIIMTRSDKAALLQSRAWDM